MKYPCLVQKRFCKTPVQVKLYNERLSEDGEPLIAFEGLFDSNYQDSAKTVLTDNKKAVQITGTIYICGDIAPKLANISDGEIKIYTVDNELYPSVNMIPSNVLSVLSGETRKIAQGTKARNPDGTVNYTKLELI